MDKCNKLWQVNDEVFHTFMTIEEIVREELRLEKCVCKQRKHKLLKK